MAILGATYLRKNAVQKDGSFQRSRHSYQNAFSFYVEKIMEYQGAIDMQTTHRFRYATNELPVWNAHPLEKEFSHRAIPHKEYFAAIARITRYQKLIAAEEKLIHDYFEQVRRAKNL